MRLVQHTAHIGEITRFIQRLWLGSLNGEDHSKDLDVNGRIVLKYVI